VVNDADYADWSINFGRNDWIYADGNRNGKIDAADYVLWRKSVSGSGETTGFLVPEAATVWYVLIAWFLIVTACRVPGIRSAAGRLLVLGALFHTGCSSKPGRVHVADIDPVTAASQAMELYDANTDGQLSDEELKAVPGILKWKSLYDPNADGVVTEEEIAGRIAKCQADKIGFRALRANVKLNGRPLSNVMVTLTPEPYQGDAIKAASGVTNALGSATLKVAPDDLPDAIKQRGINISGVYPGTYKIGLAHPQRQLPVESRDGMPLGDEVAIDTINTSIDIELSSRP
jgi:hypothetical protein